MKRFALFLPLFFLGAAVLALPLWSQETEKTEEAQVEEKAAEASEAEVDAEENVGQQENVEPTATNESPLIVDRSVERKWYEPKGYFLQLGPGGVQQFFQDDSADLTHFVARLGLGLYTEEWDFRVMYRRSVSRFDSSIPSIPSWWQFFGSYKWELPSFWSLSPEISAVVAYEFFSNTAAPADSSFFLETANSASIGFRSRFAFEQEILQGWEIGGTALIGMVNSDSYKIYVQGDLAYQLTPWVQLGAGYWYDALDVASDSSNTKEQSLALEIFAKFSFEAELEN